MPKIAKRVYKCGAPELEKLMAPINVLRHDPNNARRHPEKNLDAIKASLDGFGYQKPVVADSSGTVVAGNGTMLAAVALGWTHIPVVRTTLTGARLAAYGLADNRTAELAEWDSEAIQRTIDSIKVELPSFDSLSLGWSESELPRLIGQIAQQQPAVKLQDRFLVPPFSVLDARQGYWQDRKRVWLSTGIQSEIGRGEKITKDVTDGEPLHANGMGMLSKNRYDGKTGSPTGSGTSIFDPVLAELAYRWFCPPDGQVIDPFAGGSVRGIVAAKTGRPYWGCDLSAEQIKANREQGRQLVIDGPMPKWLVGDSRDEIKHAPKADFVFSCPPYGDLERYSDDPRDLSAMSYEDCVVAYEKIITLTAAKLKSDRFACFVVSDFRDPKTGMYRGFVGDTVRAFSKAGLQFYNDAVLVTALGSLPIRVGKQFDSGRKLGKTHQNVLVFVKGDPAKAAKACGAVDIPDDFLAGQA